jgi:hypothetical protein
MQMIGEGCKVQFVIYNDFLLVFCTFLLAQKGTQKGPRHRIQPDGGSSHVEQLYYCSFGIISLLLGAVSASNL